MAFYNKDKMTWMARTINEIFSNSVVSGHEREFFFSGGGLKFAPDGRRFVLVPPVNPILADMLLLFIDLLLVDGQLRLFRDRGDAAGERVFFRWTVGADSSVLHPNGRIVTRVKRPP